MAKNQNMDFYLPEGYSLDKNPILKTAYKSLCDGEPCILVTGGAGTGKSTFINYVRNNLENDTGKKCVVLAPTGVAAVNVSGQTIHSFFHFPIGDFENKKINLKNKNPIVDKIDLIIIDEISQVESAMMDHIDYALKLWRESKLPFGGIQILLSGDYFQLSPYIKWGGAKELFLDILNLKSQFFFDAHIFEDVDVVPIRLEKIYRQKDEHFINLLNTIRTCDNERAKDDAVDELNEKCYGNNAEISKDSLFLTIKNVYADEHNKIKLEELLKSGKELKTYKAKIENMSNEQTEKIATPEFLELCENATIMITRNIYDENGHLKLVNGNTGTVVKLKENSVVVKVKNRIEELFPKKWEMFKYVWNEKKNTIEKEVTGYFEQIPLRLGWAITIHKSQGMTLDSVSIEADEAFASGQVYVALSRCRTLDGIHLKKPLVHEKVFAEPTVKEFDIRIRKHNGDKIRLTEKVCKTDGQREIKEISISTVAPSDSDTFMVVNSYNSYKFVKKGKLSVYEATRGPWFLIDDDYKRAMKTKYIISVSGSIVCGVFSISGWHVGGKDEKFKEKILKYNIISDFRNRYELTGNEIMSELKNYKINISFEKNRPIQFMTFKELREILGIKIIQNAKDDEANREKLEKLKKLDEISKKWEKYIREDVIENRIKKVADANIVIEVEIDIENIFLESPSKLLSKNEELDTLEEKFKNYIEILTTKRKELVALAQKLETQYRKNKATL